jgi:hypothetical protein
MFAKKSPQNRQLLWSGTSCWCAMYVFTYERLFDLSARVTSELTHCLFFIVQWASDISSSWIQILQDDSTLLTDYCTLRQWTSKFKGPQGLRQPSRGCTPAVISSAPAATLHAGPIRFCSSRKYRKSQNDDLTVWNGGTHMSDRAHVHQRDEVTKCRRDIAWLQWPTEGWACWMLTVF